MTLTLKQIERRRGPDPFTHPTKQIVAYDRRNAALHEAGHLVAAWDRGIHAEAMIKLTPDRGKWDKTWTGRTRFLKPVYHWQLGDAHRLHIAVAGEIAVMRGGDEYSASVDYVLDQTTWDEAAIMSPSDWQMAGYQADNIDRRFMRAVEHTYNLIDREWLTVCRVARMLIVRARP